MSLTGRWVRKQIACYGAAVAIIIDQLNGPPGSTVPENPNPLVRIRERFDEQSGWHPDELVTRRSGRQDVLILDVQGFASPASRIQDN